MVPAEFSNCDTLDLYFALIMNNLLQITISYYPIIVLCLVDTIYLFKGELHIFNIRYGNLRSSWIYVHIKNKRIELITILSTYAHFISLNLNFF